jgi:hypothetical protein
MEPLPSSVARSRTCVSARSLVQDSGRQPTARGRARFPTLAGRHRACAGEPVLLRAPSTSRRWFVAAASYIRLTNRRSLGVA